MLTFVAIALLRIGYPFELEWMEGSMVAHIARVVAGQPLYVSPTLAFTPFAYPPLYFEVSALFARILQVSASSHSVSCRCCPRSAAWR